MSLWLDWQIEMEPDQQTAMEALFEQVIDATLQAEQVDTPVEISMSVVSEETIRETNAQFRHIDRVTDVLSFPLLEYAELSPAEEIQQGDVDPDTGEVCLGDVMICYQRALQQAEEYGHSIEREMGFLTVHSMLHLLGYDHMEPEEEKVMFDKQKAILEGIGLSR